MKTLLGWKPFFLSAFVAGGALLTPAHALETISTFPNWDGVQSIVPFGESNTATYGQTFVAPAANRRLASFSLWVGHFAGAQVRSFKPYIAAWDQNTYRAIGPVLYSGPVITVSQTDFEKITFSPNLQLTPGQKYVVFLSVSELFDGIEDQSKLGCGNEAYSGGSFVFINNGSDTSQWMSASWEEYAGSDLIFEANFSDAPNQAPSATPASATVVSGAPRALTLSGSDPDKDALAFRITSLPAHGALSEGAKTLVAADLPYRLQGAKVVYTGQSDYAGADAFKFAVSDGFLSSPNAKFALTVGADSQNPSIAITAPGKNVDLAFAFPEITGTASDDGRIERVRVVVRSARRDLYWNGNAWTATYKALAANYNSATGQWSLKLPGLKDAKVEEDTYTLVAKAYDGTGKLTSAVHYVKYDFLHPELYAIALSPDPVGGNGSFSLSGNAADFATGSAVKAGVKIVQYTIFQESSGKHWTGSTWGTYTKLTADLDVPNNHWVAPNLPSGADLTSGRYALAVYAYDKVGNSTKFARYFTVVGGADPARKSSAPAS